MVYNLPILVDDYGLFDEKVIVVSRVSVASVDIQQVVYVKTVEITVDMVKSVVN